MDKKFIYLICPVNDVADSEKSFLDDYVAAIRSQGHSVHYPHEVNQIDSTGTRILTEHRAAMRKVTEVHAYIGQKTKGSYFDFGMGHMANLPLYIVNPNDLTTRVFDNFDKFALKHSENLHFWPSEELHALDDWAEARKAEIQASPLVEYNIRSQEDLNKQFFFDFGMAFYTGKPVVLANPDETRKLAIPGKKSFQNVLLELDAKFRTGKR